MRTWAAPTADPETSAVLEGILGRWGGLWPSKGKDSDSSDSRKTFIILTFSFVLQILLISFLFLPPFPTLLWLSILLALWNLIKLLSFFFFPSVTFFYCCYKPLPLCMLGFCNSVEFSFLFFLFSFLNLIFKPTMIFSTLILCLPSLVFLPLQLIFIVYKSSLSVSV